MITMIRSSLLPYYRISARRLPPASSGSLMNSPGTIVSRRPRPTQRQPVESFSSSAATSSSSASSSEMPPIIWTTHRLTKEQILKVDQIFHKILWLDIFESQMLNDLVNEKLGIVLTKKQRKQLQAVMTALDNEDEEDNAAGAVQAEEEAKPILMDLKLAGFDASAKIKVIKVRTTFLQRCTVFKMTSFLLASPFCVHFHYRRCVPPWDWVSRKPRNWWKVLRYHSKKTCNQKRPPR